MCDRDIKSAGNQSHLTFSAMTKRMSLQVLYALALVPVGFLADKADRPRLLSGGLLIWSALTMVASKVISFSCVAALPNCCQLL